MQTEPSWCRLKHMQINRPSNSTSPETRNMERAAAKKNWCTRDSGTSNSDGAAGTFCFLIFLPANLELHLAQMAPVLLLPLPLPLWIATSPHLVEHVVPLLEMRFNPGWRDGLSLWHKQEAAVAHKSSCRGVAMPKFSGPNVTRPKATFWVPLLRGRPQTPLRVWNSSQNGIDDTINSSSLVPWNEDTVTFSIYCDLQSFTFSDFNNKINIKICKYFIGNHLPPLAARRVEWEAVALVDTFKALYSHAPMGVI